MAGPVSPHPLFKWRHHAFGCRSTFGRAAVSLPVYLGLVTQNGVQKRAMISQRRGRERTLFVPNVKPNLGLRSVPGLETEFSSGRRHRAIHPIQVIQHLTGKDRLDPPNVARIARD